MATLSLCLSARRAQNISGTFLVHSEQMKMQLLSRRPTIICVKYLQFLQRVQIRTGALGCGWPNITISSRPNSFDDYKDWRYRGLI